MRNERQHTSLKARLDERKAQMRCLCGCEAPASESKRDGESASGGRHRIRGHHPKPTLPR